MPQLETVDGEVRVLNLGADENRFHPDWLAEVRGLIAGVRDSDGPRALVVTASGKFFSNGLDLDWLGQHGDQMVEYVTGVQNLLADVLTLPLPTVAALNGHTFAAGAMLALACDFRVMRADRGFFCLPEVDIQIPFTPGMSALIQARLAPQVAHEVMTTGRRYGGTDAAACGLVDAAVAEQDVLPTAIERAAPLAAKAGPTLATIKQRMYAPAIAALRDRGSAGLG